MITDIWYWVFGTGYLVYGIWGLIIISGYVLIIGFFTKGWYRKTNVTNTRYPIPNTKYPIPNIFVSVVIAARDEEKYIGDLLKDLLLQDYPHNLMEIFIVDDHSSDQTPGIVDDFIRRNRSSKIILLKTQDFNKSGKKAAIGFGISHATGSIIITTDADCRVGPGWISSLISSFQDDKIKMVFGPVTYFPGKGFSDDFQSLEFAGLVASGAGAAMAGHAFMCNGANLAYRKDAFLNVNGFEGNEKYLSGDDVFLLHKMEKEFGRNSIKFCKDNQALVKTFPVAGFRGFIRQRIRWASKSKGYKDALSIFTAIIVFSYSLTVLLSLIAGFFDLRYLIIAAGLLLIKTITDLPLMMGITGFTGQRKLMKWFILFQLVYPVYIVVTGLLSFYRRKYW